MSMDTDSSNALRQQIRQIVERQKALRCRCRPDLELICFEERCDKNDCPIFEKESGKPAQVLGKKGWGGIT